MKILNILLKVSKDKRNVFDIIAWWELRRVLYNLIILFAGIICNTIIYLFVDLESGEDLIEPLAFFVFAILCNIGYTIGWLSELFQPKTKTYGPKMFKIGLYFTLFWVFIPALLHIFIWIENGFE